MRGACEGMGGAWEGHGKISQKSNFSGFTDSPLPPKTIHPGVVLATENNEKSQPTVIAHFFDFVATASSDGCPKPYL